MLKLNPYKKLLWEFFFLLSITIDNIKAKANSISNFAISLIIIFPRIISRSVFLIISDIKVISKYSFGVRYIDF